MKLHLYRSQKLLNRQKNSSPSSSTYSKNSQTKQTKKSQYYEKTDYHFTEVERLILGNHFNTPKDTILTIYLTESSYSTGRSGCCCFAIKPQSSFFIEEITSIPLETNEYFNVNDMNHIIQQINVILGNSYGPWFSKSMALCCLSFSPCFVTRYFQIERDLELKTLIATINSKILTYGIHLELAQTPPIFSNAQTLSFLSQPILYLCRHGNQIPLISNKMTNQLHVSSSDEEKNMDKIDETHTFSPIDTNPITSSPLNTPLSSSHDLNSMIKISLNPLSTL